MKMPRRSSGGTEGVREAIAGGSRRVNLELGLFGPVSTLEGGIDGSSGGMDGSSL
jgi:hypothetical protein